MTRVLDVARIHLVNWRMAVVMPLGILTLVLLLNWAILATVRGVGAESDFSAGFTTGGMVTMYVFVFVIALQAITQVFPFALGLSVTRRAFYLATSLYGLVQAVVFGLLLTLGLVVERATAGWGVGMVFFGSAAPVQNDLFVNGLSYIALLLASFAVGTAFGVVYKRWGQVGVYAVLVGLAVALTGAALIVTWQGWWLALGETIIDQPPLALGVGYPLLLAAVLGGAGWLALRRATP